MEYHVPPWKHQLVAIERARFLPDFALFFEMGTGKTGTAINILRHKFNSSSRILRTLIFCPPIVVPNWRDEWNKHSRLPSEKLVLLRGSGKKRLDLFKAAAWDDTGKVQGVVCITNYESLLMPELYAKFLEWRPECLVFDESHKLKAGTAKRSKLADALANPRGIPPAKLILTGTPVLNTPMDLFMQYKILDGGKTFGANFFVFRAKYFKDKNAGMPKHLYFPNYQPRPEMMEVMREQVSATGMSVKKSECLDLPPLVRKVLRVGMTPEQAKLYKEMKKDLITFLGGKACTATMAMTKALRLQQIASGFVKTVDGEETTLDATPKLEALKELLLELTPSHKVLVWAVWKKNYAEIAHLCQTLSIPFVECHGDISETKKHENIGAFRGSDEYKVFLAHPGSGGIGVNLVCAPYSIFYSRTFSLEHSLQAEARNHRGGSEIHEKITRIDLVVEDSIDELVQNSLANKEAIGENLLRRLL